MRVTPNNFRNIIGAINAYVPPPGSVGCPTAGYSTDISNYRIKYAGLISEMVLDDGRFDAILNDSNKDQISMAVKAKDVGIYRLVPGTVASRKTHGAAGTFDIAVDGAQPITGPVTVEPRIIGAGHTVVFQFNNPINIAGTAAVVDGTNIAVGASAVAAGNEVIVTIPSLAENKRVTISLTGVNGVLNTAPISMGFLVGDVNNTRSVSSSDISGVKARSGQTTTASNFNFDVNTSGAINSADISAVSARSGWVLP